MLEDFTWARGVANWRSLLVKSNFSLQTQYLPIVRSRLSSPQPLSNQYDCFRSMRRGIL